MISVRLKKTYPARPDSAAFALDLSFEATQGVTVLFGPSGSGKTLTLDLIAGFERPDDGRILLDNEILFDAHAGVHLAPQARGCGYVFQNYALFPHMSLRENLEFAAERRPRLERHRHVKEMLEQFKLTEAAGRRPHEVSGGQRQRCSIARALIGGPKVLLLDEPAQGLDAPLRAELYQVLRQVRADFGTPVVLVTHDVEECFELGDEMLILRQGKLEQKGTPAAIFDRPANAEVARLLGGFNLLAGEISALDPGRNTGRIRVGQVELESSYFPGHLKGDRVMVCVRHEQAQARPRGDRLGRNQMPVKLERASERPQGMRLLFAGGIAADIARSEWEQLRDTESWVVELPSESLRVL